MANATRAHARTADADNQFYRLKYLERFFWLIFGLAIIKSLYFLYGSIQFIFVFPDTTTRPEAFVLNGALRYAAGLPIYVKPGSYPYITNVYNPFAYLPAGIMGRIFSPGVPLVMKSGRLFSYISSLLSVGIGGLIVWRLARSLRGAIFSGAGIAYFHMVTLSESFRIRPEPGGILFSLAGALVILGKRKHRIYIGAVLFMIAFLFKQSFIAAPISVFAYFLIKREHRALIRFSSTMFILLAFYFLLMALLTDGNYYLCAIKAMAVNGVALKENLQEIAPFFVIYLWPVLLSLPLCAFLYSRLKEQVHVVHVYFFVSLIWAFVSFSKNGAAINYFSESAIVSLIIIGIFIGRPIISGEYFSKVARSLLIAFFAAYIIVDVPSNGLWEFKVPGPEDGTADTSRYVHRYQQIAGEKLVFHERIAVQLGDPVGLDWYLLTILSAQEMIDMQPLSNKIAAGDYQLIVFSKRIVTPLERDFLDVVKNGPYREKFKDENVVEYERAI